MMAALDDLPAPSSLLSSRWSRDNLITCHPAQLYDGPVVERIDPAALARLIEELAARLGPIQVGPGRMGVVTWDVACTGTGGPSCRHGVTVTSSFAGAPFRENHDSLL